MSFSIKINIYFNNFHSIPAFVNLSIFYDKFFKENVPLFCASICIMKYKQSNIRLYTKFYIKEIFKLLSLDSIDHKCR